MMITTVERLVTTRTDTYTKRASERSENEVARPLTDYKGLLFFSFSFFFGFPLLFLVVAGVRRKAEKYEVV